jgi:DNA-binding NarL/FixJ family response regulator
MIAAIAFCTAMDDVIGIMRILIADDSPVIVERLIRLLAGISGIESLDQADTVATASEAVRRLRPDVLILDMQMPGGSGLDVLKVINKDEIGCAVIVLTNFAYPQYRRKCLQSGAQFFLDKSTEFEKVSEVLLSLDSRTSTGDGSDKPMC